MRRAAGETVADMIRSHWQVVAKCFTCRLEIPVDLPRIVREKGLETSRWDRDAKCRSKGCNGRMVFTAEAPGMDRFDLLAGQPQPQDPAWKRGR
jgi:hypothetical protein